MMTWGLPIETLLLSNINDKNHPVSVIKLTTDEMNTRLKEINRFDFLGPFYTIRYNEIDKEYFKLDTTNAYTIDTCKYLKN
jgi:hypothetical protein